MYCLPFCVEQKQSLLANIEPVPQEFLQSANFYTRWTDMGQREVVQKQNWSSNSSK